VGKEVIHSKESWNSIKTEQSSG